MLNDTTHFPAYFTKFSTYYAEWLEDSGIRDSNLFHTIGWNMAIFSHAVKNKDFPIALSYLENTVGLLERLTESNAPSESSKKLHVFLENLKKQFEKFLQSKKNASGF